MKFLFLSSAVLLASCQAFAPTTRFVSHRAAPLYAEEMGPQTLASEVTSLFESMAKEAKKTLEKEAKDYKENIEKETNAYKEKLEKEAKDTMSKVQQVKADWEELEAKEKEFYDALSAAKKEASDDLKALLEKKYQAKKEEIKSMEEWKELQALSNDAYDEINKNLAELTGDKDFDLKDVSALVTKDIVDRLEAYKADYDTAKSRLAEELNPLLKAVSTFQFEPPQPYVMALPPLPDLVDLYNMAVVEDAIDDMLTFSFAAELDQRLQAIMSLTEDDVKGIGSLFQDQIKEFTGKDEYEFGDVMKTVTKMIEEADGEVDTDLLVIGISDDQGSTATIVAPLDPELKAELEALDKALEEAESSDE